MGQNFQNVGKIAAENELGIFAPGNRAARVFKQSVGICRQPVFIDQQPKIFLFSSRKLEARQLFPCNQTFSAGEKIGPVRVARGQNIIAAWPQMPVFAHKGQGIAAPFANFPKFGRHFARYCPHGKLEIPHPIRRNRPSSRRGAQQAFGNEGMPGQDGKGHGAIFAAFGKQGGNVFQRALIIGIGQNSAGLPAAQFAYRVQRACQGSTQIKAG